MSKEYTDENEIYNENVSSENWCAVTHFISSSFSKITATHTQFILQIHWKCCIQTNKPKQINEFGVAVRPISTVLCEHTVNYKIVCCVFALNFRLTHLHANNKDQQEFCAIVFLFHFCAEIAVVCSDVWLEWC